MAHARCMLDKQGYTRARTCTRPRAWVPPHKLAHMQARTRALAHTHSPTPTPTQSEICNIYCSSTATMVSRARLDVTLNIRCLSCY